MTQLPTLPHAETPTPPRLVTVTAAQWPNLFEFLHMFRGFKLAINPAKIFLALMAILLIYCAGRLFDAAWGPQVYPNEIEKYQTERPDVFAGMRQQNLASLSSALNGRFTMAQVRDPSLTQQQIDAVKDNPAAAFRLLRASFERAFHTAIDKAHTKRLDAEKSNAPRQPGEPTPAEVEQQEKADAAATLYANVKGTKAIIGAGIFDSLLAYEIHEFDLLLDNTFSFVRIAPVHTEPDADAANGTAVAGSLFSRSPDRLWSSDTIVGCLANMTITAPSWLFTSTGPMQYRPDNANTWAGWLKMISYRGLYLVSLLLLALFFLVVIAFTGGVICRLSALELAGADHPPLAEVYRFAARRLWTLIKTPIAPFLILLVIGLALAAVSIVGALPFVGPLVIGILFILFLLVGFILMLLLLGILGGFNLLYPTLAVEGADAFDAMSRAFAYVYARPWRLIFYTVISLIYGAFTLLFVTFAIYLILLLTHTFAGWGMSLLGYRYGAYSGQPLLDTLWPMPAFLHLLSPINWYAMSWPEYAGALFLHFWLFLLISCTGAYVISYYFSSHTLLYLLLRRSVDAQPLTEIYEDPTAPINPDPTPTTLTSDAAPPPPVTP